MNVSDKRSRRGLPPDDALARWSDSQLHEELVRLSGSNPPATIEGIHRIPVDEPTRRIYSGKREVVEDEFRAKLQDGIVLCSAIADSASRREVIEPSLWDVIELHFDSDFVGGKGREYSEPEFFELSGIPTNVEPLPPWLREMIAALDKQEFRVDGTYENISFKGVDYTFGRIQADIIEILHAASRTSNPWRKGKELLEEAGSSADKISRAFRGKEHWERLIESRPIGMYRLRIDREGKALPE